MPSYHSLDGKDIFSSESPDIASSHLSHVTLGKSSRGSQYLTSDASKYRSDLHLSPGCINTLSVEQPHVKSQWYRRGREASECTDWTDTTLSSSPPFDEDTRLAEEFLRRQFSIPPHIAVNLDALHHTSHFDSRPPYTLNELTRLAIYGFDGHRALLSDICDAIARRFPYYRTLEGNTWKASIRHMLSLRAIYVNVKKSHPSPGRSSYWMLDVAKANDLSRPVKRRPRRKGGVVENPCMIEARLPRSAPGVPKKMKIEYLLASGA